MATSTKKTIKKQSIKKEAQKEIYFLLLLGVMTLLILSNFGLIGAVGRGIKYFFFGIFGVVFYVIPFVIFIHAIYISSKGKLKGNIKIKFICIYTILLLVTSLWQRIYDVPIVSNAHLKDYFLHSARTKNGGGIIGGTIVKILSPTSLVGTIIILVVLITICLVILTNWSIRNSVDIVTKKGKEVAKAAKLDYAEYTQEAHIKRQERELAKIKKNEENLRKQQEKEELHNKKMQQLKEDSNFLEEEIKRKKNAYTVNLSRTKKKAVGIGATSILNAPINKKEKINTDNPFLLKEEPKEDKIKPGIFGDSKELEAKKEENIVQQKENFAEEKEIIKEVVQEEKKDNLIKEEPIDNKEEKINSFNEKLEERNENKSEIRVFSHKLPPTSLLNESKSIVNDMQEENTQLAITLQQTLENFGVNVKITDISCGPAVTRFELQPEMGVKVSKIVSLADDIKLNLAAEDIRIEAPIPGKAAIGIEVPNRTSSSVSLKELIETKEFKEAESLISFAVGKDIAGKPVMADIAKMPHILIAGATGSGKSVCINSLIMSVLFKASSEEVKMIMIDPKVVELSAYNGIPHLLVPVVTDPKKAAGALNWAVSEMEARYKKFEAIGVKNLKGYNQKIKTLEEEVKPLPHLLIIVDELADLMMVSANEVENAICRLAQLARAAGIHLVIATQRPSVNVITGLIKANVPSRIAFAVSSGVDSRTIIDMNGAEKLLGKGDMLFFPTGIPKPQRVQGAFVSDDEVAKVVEFLKVEKENQKEDDDIQTEEELDFSSAVDIKYDNFEEIDPLFEQAGKFVIEKEKGSIGMLQRNFRIGFNRAARIMDQLMQANVVGAEEGTKPRKILMGLEEFEEYLRNS